MLERPGYTGKVEIVSTLSGEYTWYVTVGFEGRDLKTVLITCDPSQDRTTEALLSVIATLVNEMLSMGVPWERLKTLLSGWKFEPSGLLASAKRFKTVNSPLQAIVDWIDEKVRMWREEHGESESL